MSLTVNNEKDTLRTDFENKTESTNSRQSKGEDPYCGKAKKKSSFKDADLQISSKAETTPFYLMLP